MCRWVCAAVIVTMLACGWQPPQSQAAAIIPDDLNEPSDPEGTQKPSVNFAQLLVERMQKALMTAGIYKGPATGVIDDDTERAVRQYQQSNQQSPTGIIDEALVTHIETSVKVGNMLDTLSIARQAHTDEAREALLSNPATSDLISEGLSDEVANPARDPTACFTNPTVRCLLDEAVESAKAITRDDMRNWALGDILVAQARAGLSEAARETIRRISDPRMIMVALGDIAEAQARAGQAQGAIAAADVIPDVATRIETYANIAQIMSGSDLGPDTTSIVTGVIEKLRQAVDTVEMDAKLVSHLAQASAALFRCGKSDDAVSLLEETNTAASNLEDIDNRDTALRHVADTYAGMGRVDHAISILNTIENKAERLPVLMSAARARASEGNPEAALEMAASIDAVRYRALVLASIAEGQAKFGDLAAAMETLEKATVATNTIELPFAKDYATSRIALSYARIASESSQPKASMFVQATSLSDTIEDDKTHAYTVWNITFYKQQSGFGLRADNIATALAVTEHIQSTSSQAWLLAELAEDRATDGHGEWAWTMFDKALSITESIKNSWGRARALSRLAQSLVRLAETGATRSPNDTNQ